MVPNSRDRIKEADVPLVLTKQNERGLTLRVLFAHSDAAGVEHCTQELRRAHFNVGADIVLSPKQFAEQVRSKYYDLVIAEYPASNWEGTQVLEILRQTDRQIPCIFLTEAADPETAAELVTEGAADCVSTEFLGHLPVAIRRALNENSLRKERDQTEKKLRHSEARYRALVGNLTYGICRCNMKGEFLNVNPALVAMLGYSSHDDLLAMNLAGDILCDPLKRSQFLGRSANQEQTNPLEIDWKRRDGTMLRVRLSGREVTNEGDEGSYEIIVEDVTQQRKLEDHLRQQAAKDPLTGLANYRHLVETVDAEINRSKRTGREFALLFLDLDGLKLINDRFGHVVGSKALCRLADVLCICSRNLDTPARFGGDEFALVLPETGEVQANLVARRICSTLANDGREPKLSVSIGVALYPKNSENVETLLGAADAALYAVKNRTRSPGATIQKKPTEIRPEAAAGSKSESVNQ